MLYRYRIDTEENIQYVNSLTLFTMVSIPLKISWILIINRLNSDKFISVDKMRDRIYKIPTNLF
jgi:hypothetical protein